MVVTYRDVVKSGFDPSQLGLGYEVIWWLPARKPARGIGYVLGVHGATNAEDSSDCEPLPTGENGGGSGRQRKRM